MDSKVVRLAAGSLFVAVLLWLAGVAAFWATLVLFLFFAVGYAVHSISPTAGRVVMTVTVALAVVSIFIPFVVRLLVGGTPTYLAESLEERGAVTGLQLSERVRPAGGGASLIQLERCKREHSATTQELAAELGKIDRDFVDRVIDEVTHTALSSAATDKIILAEEVREECSKRFRGRDASEVVSGWWGWVTSIRPILAITEYIASAWNAIPEFTGKSGRTILLGIVFIAIGLVVARYSTTYGSGIAAAGIVLILMASGAWLGDSDSWFMKLRDVVMGSGDQDLLVLALKATAIGIVVSAALGFEPKVKLATVLLAILIWVVALVAEPNASLGSVSHRFSQKMGGVSISAPLEKIFGGTKTVPCSEHDAVFRDADVGQVVRCFQRMDGGDQVIIQLHGGHWGINPSDAPVRVITWLEGREVYRGAYKSGGIPVSDRIMILAEAPTNIMVNMRKLDSAIKR